MAAKPKLGRNTGNAGKGRPKGSTNVATREIKGMILEALSRKGGADYLERQADENPVAFMSLLGKILPTQLAGDPDNPLKLGPVVNVRLSGPRSGTAP